MIDADEMRSIITEYNERLYKYCLRILGDKMAAEDVTNDVWLIIIRKMSKLRQGDDIRAYIYRVADKCIMRWRKSWAKRAAREGPLDTALDIASDAPAPFEDDAMKGLTDEELLGELERKLPEESRKLFRLRFIEKRKLEEIAAISGAPYSSVWLHIEKIKGQAEKIIRNGDHYE